MDRMTKGFARWLLPLLVVPLLMVACDDDGTGVDSPQLSVVLTDSPCALYAEATVDIGAIEIISADGPPEPLTDAGGSHNLIELQNGVTADLATLAIDPGTYLQLRLVVTGARVTLADGLQFTDGSTEKELFVPSGAQTGIKINLSTADGEEGSGIEIDDNMILVVDMDVCQNFVVQGDPTTAAGINDVLFTPLLRAVVRDVAGSISGSVTHTDGNVLTADLDGDGTAEAQSLTVQAALQSSDVIEELQTLEASAITSTSDGSYTIHFLSPGEYEVGVNGDADGDGTDDFTFEVADGDASDGGSPLPATVTVGEGEDVQNVDFWGAVVP